jgi:hypothetical protein
MTQPSQNIKRKQLRRLSPAIPGKNSLYQLIMETRHLFSSVMRLRDDMPRGQKDSSGICALMVKHADRALYLTVLIADYTSKNDREQRLRELNISLNHLKELIIIAHERGYIPKRSAMDYISLKIVELSGVVVSYAQGLEIKAKKRSAGFSVSAREAPTLETR